MSALLPCPFCGGEGYETQPMVGAPKHKMPVVCNDCHASAGDAAAWNRRAPSADARAAEAAMRERAADVADAEASVEGIAQRIATAIRALPLTGDEP